jgi:hypothetical protein
MQYAVTRGASLFLVVDLISFGNLIQVEPLPAYFGCGDSGLFPAIFLLLASSPS